jgi:hypothetical protein
MTMYEPKTYGPALDRDAYLTHLEKVADDEANTGFLDALRLSTDDYIARRIVGRHNGLGWTRTLLAVVRRELANPATHEEKRGWLETLEARLTAVIVQVAIREDEGKLTTGDQLADQKPINIHLAQEINLPPRRSVTTIERNERGEIVKARQVETDMEGG